LQFLQVIILNYMPGEYHYQFMGVENIFRYNVYRIIDQDGDELRKSNNPFSLVILTALIALQKGRRVEDELLPLKTDILKALVKKPLPGNKVRAIMDFLKHYVHFEKPENRAKFEEEILAITGKNNANMNTQEYLLQKYRREGIEKGIKEGMEAKSIAFIKSLLSNTDFTDEKIAALADVTVAFVQQVKTQG